MSILLLGGYGVLSADYISPASKSYGSVGSGSSSAQTYTVTNIGAGTITVGSVYVAGPPSFTIESDTCTGVALAPAGTCTFVGRFTPSGPGSYAATIELLSDDLLPTIPTAALTGTSPTGPELAVEPTSWDAGVLSLGDVSDQTFTATNIGTGSVIIGVPSLSGDSQFSMQSNGCSGLTLAPGDTCDTIVRFTPTDGTDRTGTLTIPSDAAPVIIGLLGDAFDEGAQLDAAYSERKEPTGPQDPTVIDPPGTLPNFAGFTLTGTHNGLFRESPEDPSSNIDLYTSSSGSNFLPAWRFIQDAGGKVTAKWTSPAGVRFTKAANGTVGQRAYLESTTHIMPSITGRDFGNAVIANISAPTGGMSAFLDARYLDSAGVATGSDLDQAASVGFNVAYTGTGGVGIAPTDAEYLRVRLVAEVASAGTGTFDVSFALLRPFEGRDEKLMLGFSTGASVNDLDLTGYGGASYEPTGADRALNGVLATGWYLGEKVVIHNSGSTYDIVINHNSLSSSGLNRIYCPSGSNIAIKPLSWVYLMRNETSAGVERWFVGHPA